MGTLATDSSRDGTDSAKSGGVQDMAEDASRSPWVERLGSLGFFAKGLLYIVSAAIAGSVGFVGGGEASQTGAISQLGEESYGPVLLAVLAVGLGSYTLLRMLHVVINPSGEDGLKGVGMRISYAARAVLYGGLTLYTVSSLLGSGGGGGGSERRLTGQLLELPAGRFIVAAIALVMLGIAAYELYAAFTQTFMDHLNDATARQRKITKVLGSIGYVARGIVFGTVGVLFGQAALRSDSSEAGGVDKALQTIASSPAGTGVLTVVALGLAAYGLWCWAVGAWGTARKAG